MTKLVVRSDAMMYMLLDADAKITGILGLTSGQVPSDLVKSTTDLLTLRLDSEVSSTSRRVLANDTLTVAVADTSRRLPIIASDSLTVVLADNVSRRTVGANDTLRVIVVDGVIARPIIVSDVLTVQLIEAPIVAAIYKGDDPLPLLSTETVIESGPATAGATIQDEAGGTITDEGSDQIQED